MCGYRGSPNHLVEHPFAGRGDGKTFGTAVIPGPNREPLKVIFSNGRGWEHVSVSCCNRTPTWLEMCFVKELFWDEEDCVIQFHPPKSKYVKVHPYVLHLWRPVGQALPVQETSLVG
jgi:hypothetical protein